MRFFIGKRVGPVWLGVSGSFHPSRVFAHVKDRVPSPLAWVIVLASLAALYAMLTAAAHN